MSDNTPQRTGRIWFVLCLHSLEYSPSDPWFTGHRHGDRAEAPPFRWAGSWQPVPSELPFPSIFVPHF
jgi:hypothetical protein